MGRNELTTYVWVSQLRQKRIVDTYTQPFNLADFRNLILKMAANIQTNAHVSLRENPWNV